MSDGIERSAVISADGLYRYNLTRRWSDGSNVTFIMLNPSRADDTVDDRTIAKIMRFAQTWGFGSLNVMNLYAFRTPYPNELWKAEDPVGAENNRYLRAAAESSDLLVAAWGNHAHSSRVTEALALPGFDRLHCLARNKGGQPKHPLYTPAGAAPILWSITP